MQQVGKYQLIRKLATGGMAEVFLAKAAGPMGFEKTVVLKRILPHLAEEPAFVQMFLTEAKLAARLTHPHIVHIFDFGEADGAYFLAMEYIDGPSLRTLLKDTSAQGQTLPPELCARLVAHACEGLAFAHDFMDPETGEAQGLIHRDVSPDNILLSRQGAVKVVDFGIAKAAGQSHKTESGVIKGKLAYMPPEQLRARPLDRRVDVYALGVVLYELLTGRKPYVSESDAGLMQAILFEDPPPAAQLRPGLPPRLSGILERALAKDREQRYPDCHALQSDLEEFIVSGGKPVTNQQVAQLIVRAASRPDLPVVPPNLGRRQARPGASEVAATQTTKVERPPSGAHPTLVLRRAAMPPLSTDLAPPPPSNKRSRRWLGWSGTLVAGVLLVAGSGFVIQHAPTPIPPQPVMPVRPASAEAPSAPTPSPPQMLFAGDAGTQPEKAVVVPSDDAGVRIAESAQASAAESQPAPAKEEGTSTPPSSNARMNVPATPKTEPEAVVLKDLPHQVLAPKRPVQGIRKAILMGRLVLNTQANTVVTVDGKVRGTAPVDDVKLSAGRHDLYLFNGKMSRTLHQIFEIKPDQATILTINLAD